MGMAPLLAGLLVTVASPPGQEVPPRTLPSVVHAVLFYSPGCPHCRNVISEDLRPLQDRHGARLVILALDTSQPQGGELFRAAVDWYGIPRRDWGVPMMIVGGEVLHGSLDIPARFPVIVDAALSGDGIDLPEFPPLLSLLQRQGMLERVGPQDRNWFAGTLAAVRGEIEGGQATGGGESTTERAAEAPEEGTDVTPGPGEDAVTGATVGESEGTVTAQPRQPSAPSTASTEAPALTAHRRAAPDPDTPTMPEGPEPTGGEEAAAHVQPGLTDLEGAERPLAEMSIGERFGQDRAGNSLAVAVLAAMVMTVLVTARPSKRGLPAWPRWSIPVLVCLGLLVASYLSFVEVTQRLAVCGPVGDCNTVQQSSYARLFGLLPVGVLGLIGYLGLLTAWLLHNHGPERIRPLAALGLWAMALTGTLFSIYLTFLEPFVIGATCAWCITSALVMTLILWAAAPMVRDARAGA